MRLSVCLEGIVQGVGMRPFVGLPTTAAIIGNKIAPGLGDTYLARTGFSSQQTDEPADPHAPDNLWRPVAGDHGAHGRFDARARPRSGQLWLTTHRGAAVVAMTAIAALLSLAGSALRHRRRGRW